MKSPREDESASTGGPGTAKSVVVAAVWLGLITGVVEGLGWLIIQRFDRLTGVWTQVLWIAPVVNGLIFLLLGVALVALSRVVGRRWWEPLAVFTLAGAAAANFVALVFQPYVYTWVLPILVLGFASVLTRIYRRNPTASDRLFRRTLPVVAGAVLALFVGVQSFYLLRERSQVAALSGTAADAPDVLIVLIDAQRADHLSAYGYARTTSPYIDQLASEGVLFERAVSASPYSLPSHASLLSGLFPHEHDVEWLEFNVFRDAPYPSIAEAMRDRGYRTGAFSANPFWFTREQGFGRGFMRFEDFYHSVADMAYRTVFGKVFEKLMPFLGLEQIPARKEATENTDRLLDWALRDDAHPFFAFINYFDVHDPYTPPQPYRSRFSVDDAPGGILNWRLGRGEPELTPEERASEIEAYDGALAYVDDEIRRLLEERRLARPGRDVLVVVTSDHGEAFDEHGGYLHARSLYREEIMVPLVIHGPGVPAGVRIARPVTNVAVPATILELLPDDRAAEFGSPSLVALWTRPETRASWPYPLSEAGERDWADPVFPIHHGDIRSLTSPDWHFISYDTLPRELFAWDDALERFNRADDPELRDVVADFLERLGRYPRPVSADERY